MVRVSERLVSIVVVGKKIGKSSFFGDKEKVVSTTVLLTLEGEL